MPRAEGAKIKLEFPIILLLGIMDIMGIMGTLIYINIYVYCIL